MVFCECVQQGRCEGGVQGVRTPPFWERCTRKSQCFVIMVLHWTVILLYPGWDPPFGNGTPPLEIPGTAPAPPPSPKTGALLPLPIQNYCEANTAKKLFTTETVSHPICIHNFCISVRQKGKLPKDGWRVPNINDLWREEWVGEEHEEG